VFSHRANDIYSRCHIEQMMGRANDVIEQMAIEHLHMEIEQM